MGNRITQRRPSTQTPAPAAEAPEVVVQEAEAVVSADDAVAIMDNLRAKLAQQKTGRTKGDITKNPLVLMLAGHKPQSTLAAHKKSAKIGNLFFEYASNVAQLRGVITKAAQIAEFFEDLGLMTVDWDAGTYIWHDEPMPKNEFLALVNERKLSAV